MYLGVDWSYAEGGQTFFEGVQVLWFRQDQQVMNSKFLQMPGKSFTYNNFGGGSNLYECHAITSSTVFGKSELGRGYGHQAIYYFIPHCCYRFASPYFKCTCIPL